MTRSPDQELKLGRCRLVMRLTFSSGGVYPPQAIFKLIVHFPKESLFFKEDFILGRVVFP